MQTSHQGFTLWFTGMSGAGKSTLSELVYAEFKKRGYRVELLDGDIVRTNLGAGLTFSKADRDINVRRIGFVCDLLSRNGAIAISAAISPYRNVREECREMAQKSDTPFIEVYCRASLDALVARDVKGLYKRALAGEIANFTGVSDPYEAPENPEVLIESDREDVDVSLQKVFRYLEERGLMEKA